MTRARARNTVLPVWLEVKQWKSGKEMASVRRGLISEGSSKTTEANAAVLTL
jgi:hypothetical protein